MKKLIPPLSPEAQNLKKGVYQHYKGGKYELLLVARMADEDLDECVVYRTTVEPDNIWIRTVREFCEVIEINGKIIPRYRFIE